MITFMQLHDFGRFGNRLFMIAGTIGTAIKHGYEYGFPFWEEREYFKNTLPFVNEKFNSMPQHHYRKHLVKMGFDYQEKHVPDNQILFGFMQTGKYFSHCPELIRHYFELKHIPGLPEIKEKSIALHYRGTDYVDHKFPLCPATYYQKALDKMPKDHMVYIFSDDLEVIKTMLAPLQIEQKITFIETGHYIADFYLMTQCKHFIISNSTFAWWGAWLGKHQDKMVMAPNPWFAKKFEHNHNDIYETNWEVIAC